MRRSIHTFIGVSILMSLLAWPSLPGVIAAQPASRGLDCQESGTPAATPAASPVTRDASTVELEQGNALFWRSGEQGVLLLHGAAFDAASWDDQARALANQGYTVLALEELTPEAIDEGLRYLTEACGTSGVTLIGASAGGSAALDALGNNPDGIAGLILLGATGEVDTLGEYPKLFVASEGEGLTEQLTTMAEGAPGDQNETLILPGSAHAQATFETDRGDVLVEAILTFLDETAVWS